MLMRESGDISSRYNGDPLVCRRRSRLIERLPGIEDELAALFADLDDGDTSLLCADADGVVLFLLVGDNMRDDLFGRGLWVGMIWHRHLQPLTGAVACHAEPVLAPDRRQAATLVVLARAGTGTLALARLGARALTYRAIAEEVARHGVMTLSVAEGPELMAHRGRLQVAERVACGDAGIAQSLELAQRLSTRNIPILLIGETGTGKEVFARAVHALSPRYAGRFVAVNCASVPEALIESELFGYQAGAFTGASTVGYRGRILQADDGTLFLDEIGDMPPPLQARLLRVIETREVVPLGSDDAIPVDLQIISATHRDLEQSVQAGLFREDLYYRLCGMRITLPPLRERRDPYALAAAILAEESGGQAALAPEAAAALSRYAWPGNLRELRNTLRVALAFAEDGVVGMEHLPAPIGGWMPSHTSGGEREQLLQEIERQRWNISAVARKLGISRNTLYRRMRRHDINVPGNVDEEGRSHG
jgi:sigma-54 dependent transcriptional regulator, acetoin dehydrogenase operon transcriptional activator AcoR